MLCFALFSSAVLCYAVLCYVLVSFGLQVRCVLVVFQSVGVPTRVAFALIVDLVVVAAPVFSFSLSVPSLS